MKDDLELLLESLCEDILENDDGVEILRKPQPGILGNCCTYSYASLNG